MYRLVGKPETTLLTQIKWNIRSLGLLILTRQMNGKVALIDNHLNIENKKDFKKEEKQDDKVRPNCRI